MNNAVLSFIMVCLLPTVFLSGLAFEIQPVKGAGGTIYIRADGSTDPPTAPISTVDNLTYTFTGNINDSIVVERSNIILDGAGCTVQGTGAWDSKGISLNGISNVTIENTNIKNFTYGLWLFQSSNNTISRNLMEGNEYGFDVEGDTLSYFMQSVDVSNLIDGKPVYYLVNQKDLTINPATHPNVGFLALVNCTRMTIQNLSLTNKQKGLLIAFTTNSTVSDNSITNNWDGIYLTSSSNNIICGNDIRENNESGIRLEWSSNNSIAGNNVSNGDTGIDIFSSSDDAIMNNALMSNPSFGFSVEGANIIQQASNNTFLNNTVTGSVCGLQFWGGGQCYNTVENNLFYSNGAGIEFGENARYNTLCGNTLSNNQYGMIVFGVWPESSKAYGNKIFNNNFIDNTHQASDNATDNVWNDGYPSGGNYWSDYKSTDLYSGPHQNVTGSDGITDSPYIIATNNTDLYPLMGMFNNYDVTYFTLPLIPHACNVTVISNSTISDVAAPIWLEHPEVITLEFKVTGEQGTAGFCRVSFPTVMMNGTYHVLVNGAEIPYTLLPSSESNDTYLYFTYTHSTDEVIITPEYSSILVLTLFVMATLFAMTTRRRKHVV
jgi:parallel beta-helix repeat protein